MLRLLAEDTQNHKDLMSFPDCGHKELKYEKWTPIMKPEFLSNESILDQIRQKDRLSTYPTIASTATSVCCVRLPSSQR